jgi:hypothetical protein
MWSPVEITFEIEEGDDGQVAIVIITTPEGEIELLAEFHEVAGGLRLIGAHIFSAMRANTLSIARIRQIAAAAMERLGYDAIEVEGAVRTSGASPGRKPSVLRFTRERGAAACKDPQEHQDN